MIGTAVLARLLTPAGKIWRCDHGDHVSLLLVSFGLNGFTEAVIQCEDIDHYTASNLFWLNRGAGLVVAVAFASPARCWRAFTEMRLWSVSRRQYLWADFYYRRLSYTLSSPKARHALHGSVAGNDVASRTVYTAVAIILALRGWGYWALVAGLVASSLSVDCRGLVAVPMDTEPATANGANRTARSIRSQRLRTIRHLVLQTERRQPAGWLAIQCCSSWILQKGL